MHIQVDGKEVKTIAQAIPMFASAKTISVQGCPTLSAIHAPVASSVTVSGCVGFKSVDAPMAKTIAVWR